MKRLLVAALLVGAALFATAQPAACIYCPSYRCWGATCGACACVSPPGGGGGSCYGVERVPTLREQGYTVLEGGD